MHRGASAFALVVAAAAVALVWGAGLSAAQQTAPASGPEATSPRLDDLPSVRGAGPGSSRAAPGGPAGPSAADANAPRVRAGRQDDGGMGNIWWFYAVLLGGIVLMYVWMARSRKRQEARRKEMIAALKKGDKVVSIGGIIGTIIEARDDEVLVKVDETNNVRMRFARWAIRGPAEEGKKTPPEETK